MASVELTYWLGAVQILLCAGAFYLTWRPLVTTFHFFLLSLGLSCGVVPVLDTYLGVYVFSPPSPESYAIGLVCQLIFTLFYLAGYLTTGHSQRWKAAAVPVIKVTAKDLLICFAVGFTSVVLMHILSHGEWIAPGRATTITAGAPGGPILFRTAAIPLVITLVLSYCYFVERGLPSLILISVVSLASATLLVLLNQRGIALSSLVVVLWMVERRKRMGTWKALAACCLLLMGISYMRVLVGIASNRLAGGEPAAASIASPSDSMAANVFVTSIIRSFSSAEIWPVVFDYTDENGLLLGKTILAWPATLVPLPVRSEFSVQTGPDRINYYMFGENRLRTWFGVNVSFPQELYMNFGWVGLMFGLLSGVLTCRMDRWLSKTTSITTASVFVAYAVFCAGGLCGDMGGTLQYLLAIVLIRWGIVSLTRVRIARKRSYRQEAHALLR